MIELSCNMTYTLAMVLTVDLAVFKPSAQAMPVR